MNRAAFTMVWAFATIAMPMTVRAELAGQASVIDGDTLEIGGQKIRLYGIDAPETDQMCVTETQWPCGRQATLALDKKVAGRVVTCAERDGGRDGLVLAQCRAGGEDLAAWLVSRGWALAYRQDSADYVGAEETARAARRGVWRGTILAPWDWRVSQQAKARANLRAARERMPAHPVAAQGADAGPRTVTVRARNDGHFQVDAAANGRSIRFIVDTGATLVTLSRQDAVRIGIDVNTLRFDRQVRTANGTARVALVTLRELRIESISRPDVEAVVIGGQSEYSLLGMSFLTRLQSYAVSGSTLTLTDLP